MILITLPLIVLAAPVLLVLRGHYGSRTLLLLVLSLFAPLMIPGFIDGLTGHYRAGTSLWHPEVRSFARTTAQLIAPALLFGALNLPQLIWRRIWTPAESGDRWDFGAFVALPPGPFATVADVARVGLAVTLAPSIGRLLDERAFGWHAHVGAMAGAAFLLTLLAHRNGNVLPGFGTGSLLARVQPLWRHTARIIARVRKSRDGLGAIFSRRPKDLRAIAAGTTPRT